MQSAYLFKCAKSCPQLLRAIEFCTNTTKNDSAFQKFTAKQANVDKTIKTLAYVFSFCFNLRKPEIFELT